MTKTLKIVSYASIEIILGAVILYFNLKAFLLYFLIIYFFNSHRRTESLEVIMRRNFLLTSIMIHTIVRKLGITDEEIAKSDSTIKAAVDKKEWDALMNGLEECIEEFFKERG
jgi:hypothetical protein